MPAVDGGIVIVMVGPIRSCSSGQFVKFGMSRDKEMQGIASLPKNHRNLGAFPWPQSLEPSQNPCEADQV